MNDLLTDPKALALALLGVVMTILTWIGKGALKRLEHIERNYASKADLQEKHEENLGNFNEIKQMIRASDQDAAKSRHDLRDKIGVVAGQVAKIEGQLSGRYPRLER